MKIGFFHGDTMSMMSRQRASGCASGRANLPWPVSWGPGDTAEGIDVPGILYPFS